MNVGLAAFTRLFETMRARIEGTPDPSPVKAPTFADGLAGMQVLYAIWRSAAKNGALVSIEPCPHEQDEIARTGITAPADARRHSRVTVQPCLERQCIVEGMSWSVPVGSLCRRHYNTKTYN